MFDLNYANNLSSMPQCNLDDQLSIITQMVFDSIWYISFLTLRGI